MCIIHLLLIQFFTHQFTSFRASNIYIFFFCFLVSRFLIVLPYLFYHSFFFLQNIFGCWLFFWIFFFFFAVSTLNLWQFLHSPSGVSFFSFLFLKQDKENSFRYYQLMNCILSIKLLPAYSLFFIRMLPASQQHRSLSILLAAEYLEPKTVPAIRQYLSKKWIQSRGKPLWSWHNLSSPRHPHLKISNWNVEQC